MALAAGGDEIVRVDHGIRVGGRQDFVVAVATGAVGDDGRAVLRRQAVIAFQVGFHPVGRKVIFAVEIDRGVAAAANLGNFQRRIVLQRLDFMFRMAVGAGGRVAFAGGHGLAVNAGRHVARLLRVAPAARLGLTHKMERRRRRGRRQNVVRTVAIRAGGGVLVAGLSRQAVNAGAVAFALLLVAARAIDRGHGPVVVGMFCGHVRMATDAGIGFVDGGRQDGRVNEQGFGYAGGVGCRQRVVGMAIQTVAVGKPRPRRQLPEEAKRGEEQKLALLWKPCLSIGQGRQPCFTSIGESLPFFVEVKTADGGVFHCRIFKPFVVKS